MKRYRKLTAEDFDTMVPGEGTWIQNDNRFLDIIRAMLTDQVQPDSYIPAARAALALVIETQKPISDETLAQHIDAAALFICDPALACERTLTERPFMPRD